MGRGVSRAFQEKTPRISPAVLTDNNQEQDDDTDNDQDSHLHVLLDESNVAFINI
jgi:hypothetical protein